MGGCGAEFIGCKVNISLFFSLFLYFSCLGLQALCLRELPNMYVLMLPAFYPRFNAITWESFLYYIRLLRLISLGSPPSSSNCRMHVVIRFSPQTDETRGERAQRRMNENKLILFLYNAKSFYASIARK